jgi:ABC-type siderophore export system fused ATPase/permease subunit
LAAIFTMTLQRALTLILGLLVAIVGLSISLLAVALLAVVGAVVFAYYWWKTRDLRRAIQAQMEEARASQTTEHSDTGVIVDGEWQRHDTADAKVSTHAVLPAPTYSAGDADSRPVERQ